MKKQTNTTKKERVSKKEKTSLKEIKPKKLTKKVKKDTPRFSFVVSGKQLSVSDNFTSECLTFREGQGNYLFMKQLIETGNYELVFSLNDPSFFAELNFDGLIKVDRKGSEIKYYLITEEKEISIPKFGEAVKDFCSDIYSYANAEYLKLFLSRLLKNESKQEIPHFLFYLSQQKFIILETGDLIAYKAVREDLYDKHSGTILNSIGSVIKMERSKVTQDSLQPCAPGLHVGTKDYIQNYARSESRYLAVKIRPEDLVSVPGINEGKIRVCEYEVLCEVSMETILTKHTLITKEEFLNNNGLISKTLPKIKLPKISEDNAKKLKDLSLPQRVISWVLSKINRSKNSSISFGTLTKALKKDFPEMETKALKTILEQNFIFEKDKKLSKSTIRAKN